jgi:cytochrome P450 family 4
MLEMEDLGTRLSQLYSSIVTFWISIIPFFLVFEPRDLQIILSTNRYTTKNMFYSLLHNFIGDGLITNTGSCSHTLNKKVTNNLRRKVEATS